MAKYPKEQLEKLLSFLKNDVLSEPGNQWFVDELQCLLPQKTSVITQIPEIKKIEGYLALDYNIDREVSTCDYSFLAEELQEKAESDFREMKRYKLGLRGHKKDFAEFCRYAILQAELLLNYFYVEYYGDRGGMPEIIEVIRKANTSSTGKEFFKPYGKLSKIEEIPFSFKLWAFAKDFRIDKKYLEWAKEARNAVSHRSLEADKNLLRELGNKLARDHGVILKKDGSLPFIDKTLLNNPDVKRYLFELFLEQQPYERVEDELKSLVDRIGQWLNLFEE